MHATQDQARSATDYLGNLLALAFTILVNGLANGLPLGGQTTGEISDKYPSLFTPAAYVFSIWGLIYLLLITFAIWQALPSQRHNSRIAAIRMPFATSCLANGAWIFAWHYDLLLLSLALMFLLLGSLLWIYRSLIASKHLAQPAERWLLQLPFSVYLGWITVATIANLSALQIYYGWDNAGLSALAWTYVKIGTATAIAIVVLVLKRDQAFALVAVWALVGIGVKHTEPPLLNGLAFGSALLCLVIVCWLSIRPKLVRP